NMAARKAAFAALRTPFIKLPTPRSSPSPWSVSSPSGGGGRGSSRPEGVTPSSPSGPTGGGGRVFEAGGGASRATEVRSPASTSVPANLPHLGAASANERSGASRATDRRFVVADFGSAKSVPFNTPPPQHLPAAAPVPPPAQPLTTRDLCRLILTPFKPKPSAARRLLNRAGSG
ncbi:MAG: hypothetical protein ACKVS8_03280, partial [Phycisphaerales bacterium]